MSRLALAALLIFHAGLLGWHILDGRLQDPGTSMRWVVGGALFAGFLFLRRLGVPLVWGRKAVVLWLLVVLLHCHALLTSPAAVGDDAAWPAALATLATEVTVGAALAALGLLLVALWSRFARRVPRSRWVVACDAPRLAHACAGFAVVAAPRPPPAS